MSLELLSSLAQTLLATVKLEKLLNSKAVCFISHASWKWRIVGDWVGFLSHFVSYLNWPGEPTKDSLDPINKTFVVID